MIQDPVPEVDMCLEDRLPGPLCEAQQCPWPRTGGVVTRGVVVKFDSTEVPGGVLDDSFWEEF
jgi:hypothetical protein